jgi:hypothetical protein
MLGALIEWRAYQHLTPCSTLCWVGGDRYESLLGLIIIVINTNDRDGVVWKESLGSFVENMGGLVAHNRLSLHMQVSCHSVTIPAAHHAYAVHVDLYMKECHAATGPQGPSTYL